MKYAPRHYARALLQILKGTPAKEHPRLIKDFARLLLQNNDASQLEHISEEFERVYNEEHDIRKVHIAAATPAEGRAVRQLFAGKEFSVSEVIDPSLGAGAAIRMGDVMADTTVRSRIAEVRAALIH